MASFRKQIQLIRDLFHGQLAKTGPFFVTWDFVGRFNLQRIGCPYHTFLNSHKLSAGIFLLKYSSTCVKILRDLIRVHWFLMEQENVPYDK